jgi:hypothetical protein
MLYASQQGFVCSVDMITSPERDMYVTWDMQKKVADAYGL